MTKPPRFTSFSDQRPCDFPTNEKWLEASSKRVKGKDPSRSAVYHLFLDNSSVLKLGSIARASVHSFIVLLVTYKLHSDFKSSVK